MVSLDRFETFRAVVDCGSLSAAADTLGQTRAASGWRPNWAFLCSAAAPGGWP
ncbi:hypothetical protein Q029_00643 [Pseudomonas aeruginosa BWHPSA016]|nr:hypothetical protein Q029_00643 [Pseudomonas aeruginosa BWHPSA016]